MKENMYGVTTKDKFVAIFLICAMYIGIYKIFYNAYVAGVRIVTKVYSMYYKKKHGTEWESYEIWKEAAKFEL